MADAQVLRARGTGVTSTSTSWTQVAQIAAGSFTASKNYLLLVTAHAKHTSSANEIRLRLVHGTTPTVFTDGSLATEVIANTQDHSHGWMYVYTQPGTTEAVTLEVSNSGTGTVTVEWGEILAINLDDVGSQNTEWYYNEVTADYTTTTTPTAQAAVTFTPNGTDDWLLIANGVFTGVQIADNHRMDLNDSVAGMLVSLDIEGEDNTNEIRGYTLISVVTPTNASHTFSARFSHETNAHTVVSSRIVALNLNKFAQHAFTFDAAEVDPADTPSWTTTRTLSPTPSATGDWVVIASFIADTGNTDNDIAARVQINPGGGGLADDPAHEVSPGTTGWDFTDEVPVDFHTLVSLTSGAARDINLDVQNVAGTTPFAIRVEDRLLVAFSVALAGSSPQTIDCNPGVVDTAGNQATVTPGAVTVSATESQIADASGNQATIVAVTTINATESQILDAVGNSATVIPGAVTITATESQVADVSGNQATVIPGAITITATESQILDAIGNQASVSLAMTIACQPGMIDTVGNAASIVPGAVTVTATESQIADVAGNQSTVIPGAVVITATESQILDTVGNSATVSNTGGGSQQVNCQVGVIDTAGNSASLVVGPVTVTASESQILDTQGNSATVLIGPVVITVTESQIIDASGNTASLVLGPVTVTATESQILDTTGNHATVIPGIVIVTATESQILDTVGNGANLILGPVTILAIESQILDVIGNLAAVAAESPEPFFDDVLILRLVDDSLTLAVLDDIFALALADDILPLGLLDDNMSAPLRDDYLEIDL